MLRRRVRVRPLTPLGLLRGRRLGRMTIRLHNTLLGVLALREAGGAQPFPEGLEADPAGPTDPVLVGVPVRCGEGLALVEDAVRG